jgi:uncharacterized protein YndB with AHSA1/START domain
MTESPDYDAMRGYTITRVYDAPRALVWRAISEADLFARWFGAEVELDVHEWDFRPQGQWRGTMTYEGNKIPWVGKFLEIDEPSRLVLAITDAGEIKDDDDVIIYELADQGDRTELVLSQRGGGLSDEEYEQAREGSASFLEELAKVVATL